MPKRRRKRANPVTNRNWLLFRVAGSITVLDPKHFEGESADVRQAAVACRAEMMRLQRLLKGKDNIQYAIGQLNTDAFSCMEFDLWYGPVFSLELVFKQGGKDSNSYILQLKNEKSSVVYQWVTETKSWQQIEVTHV